MDIGDFIDRLSMLTLSRYFITYHKEKKWYTLKIFNLYINEIFIVNDKLLENKDKCYKRIDEIVQILDKKEKKLEENIKKHMGV